MSEPRKHCARCNKPHTGREKGLAFVLRPGSAITSYYPHKLLCVECDALAPDGTSWDDTLITNLAKAQQHNAKYAAQHA